MTDVLIKRELLERLACEVIPKTHQEMLDASDDFGAAIKELRAILAAPRQPEGDHGWLVSLELPEAQCNCAWNPDSHDKTCPVYLRDRMADAQRAIAELREECEHLKACQENDMLHMTGLVAERDTLRQQLAELRDMLSCEVETNIPLRQKAFDLTEQRDKLADILRDLVPGCKWRFMRPRIDAALAEIDHGNE